MTHLKAALEYARQGWSVFPVHGVEDGHCDCGNPQCDKPGKHPLTDHGLKDATTDPAKIEGWWRRWPSANIGYSVTGHVVLDVDGEEGLRALAELEARYGRLPETLKSKTGRGEHYYFQANGAGIRPSAGKFGEHWTFAPWGATRFSRLRFMRAEKCTTGQTTSRPRHCRRRGFVYWRSRAAHSQEIQTRATESPKAGGTRTCSNWPGSYAQEDTTKPRSRRRYLRRMQPAVTRRRRKAMSAPSRMTFARGIRRASLERNRLAKQVRSQRCGHFRTSSRSRCAGSGRPESPSENSP